MPIWYGMPRKGRATTLVSSLKSGSTDWAVKEMQPGPLANWCSQIISDEVVISAGCTPACSSASSNNSGTGYIDPAADGKEPTIIDYTNVVEEVGEPAEVEEHEIIVVGAGGTGLAAGIQAFEDGLDVVVLEKKALAGGTFPGSEGMFAVGSHLQKEAGYEIDVEEIIGRLMTYHHYVPDPELYRAFFNKTAETIDWLEKEGVGFQEVVALGESDPTWHLYAGERSKGLGAQFMVSFIAHAEEIGLDIRYETPAKQLIVDESGAVTGVLAVDKDGKVIQFNAKAVIIGTDGYANNDNMMKQLCEVDPAKICAAGATSGREGDGIRMARHAGAIMAPAPGTAAWYGPILYGTTYVTPVQAATSLQPVLWINEACERFVAEDMFHRNFPFAGMAHKSQKTVYTMLTQKFLDQYEAEGVQLQVGVYCETGIPLTTLKADLQELIDEGNEHIWVANTVADLAAAAGLDADKLTATVEKYNAMCEAGKDTQFDKADEFMIPLKDEEGPYYLFEVQNGYFCTVGGIKVTTKCEAVNDDRQVIPGLYMGGMDAGGFYGDAYDAGIAAGSCASWAINSGRMAEEAAKEYIGQ